MLHICQFLSIVNPSSWGLELLPTLKTLPPHLEGKEWSMIRLVADDILLSFFYTLSFICNISVSNYHFTIIPETQMTRRPHLQMQIAQKTIMKVLSNPEIIFYILVNLSQYSGCIVDLK